jgi:hypothetical protein
LVVGSNESLDMGNEVFNCGEACSAQGLSAERRKPDFDLIEPRGMSGGKVKVEPRMLALKSRIADPMRAEIVEHDMEIFVGVRSFQPGHEIKELLAPFARFAYPINATGGHFQSGKESRRSMTLNRSERGHRAF